MITRRLARLEDSYAERARRQRNLAEYLEEQTQYEADLAANPPLVRQLERLIDTDPWARPMLLRALHLCNGGCSPADRPEAERLASALNQKLLALHIASGDAGDAITLYAGSGNKGAVP